MTFCKEEITVESVTVLHTRELLNPKHCAWADLPDGHFKKRAKQGQLRLLLGDTRTPKGRKKVTGCNSLANNLEAALKHSNHGYSISSEQQVYHIVEYLELRAAGKIKTARPITSFYNHMRANLGFLRKVVEVQGHMPDMAIPSNWHAVDCVSNAMQAARQKDYNKVVA